MKKLTITGNVGKDAEILINPNNNEYFAKFSVARAVGTKDKPKTDWVEVTCNGRFVDLARNYIKKGGKILVEGYPQAHAYVNRDGVVIPQLKLQARLIELLGRPQESDDEVVQAEDEMENTAQ